MGEDGAGHGYGGSGTGRGSGSSCRKLPARRAGAGGGAAAPGAAAYAKLMPTKDSDGPRRSRRSRREKSTGRRAFNVTASFTGLQMGEHGFHGHEKGTARRPTRSSLVATSTRRPGRTAAHATRRSVYGATSAP